MLITFPQVSGLKRRSWPVGRVLSPVALRPAGGRPSIYDRRCRRPPAVYPRTRAGRPRTYVRRSPRHLCRDSRLLDLAPGGVCRAGRVAPVAGGLLHHRFTLTCPSPARGRVEAGGLFSVALSRGSPRVGVAHRPALRSPDLPRRMSQTLSGAVRRGRPASSSARSRVAASHHRIDPRRRTRPPPERRSSPAPSVGEAQLRFSAVSSMTNDVWREESSAPVKLTVTVWPAKDETLNERSV